MKALPPGRERKVPGVSEDAPTWVVFEVAQTPKISHQPTGLQLREVARIQAANEKTAVISAAESRQPLKSGLLIALRLDQIRVHEVRLQFYVTLA